MLQTVFLLVSAAAWFMASAAQARAVSERPIHDTVAFTRRTARLNALAALCAGLAAVMTAIDA